MTSVTQTIYALSTAAGRGGVAVVRVSGANAWESLKNLTGTSPAPVPRNVVLRTLSDPATGLILDHAMVIGFCSPSSFTGEDVVEYHLHGGIAVVQGVLKALAAEDHHRLAHPGEFTRRAFENGKIDLTAAEAIGDLIEAETEAQREQALTQMDGGLFRLYEGWKNRLTHILALMEADLDFSDQDLPEDLLLRVRPDLSDLREELTAHLDDNRRGERLRSGFHLVILGSPNAGKSSLLNALVQRDVAIVSALPGTTRDIIEAHLNIGGYPAIISDTAGLRPEQVGQEGQEGIESEGIRRALCRAKEADLKILLFDGTRTPDPHTLNLIDETSLLVANKADLGLLEDVYDERFIRLSTQSGEGMETFLSEVCNSLRTLAGPQMTTPSLTRTRHRHALEKALVALERSVTAPLPELAAEDVRLAIRFLGEITGRVGVEELLDKIFRDFCIGK